RDAGVVHDLLDLDVRDPATVRGGRVPRSGRQPRDQRGRRAGRRRARPSPRKASVNEDCLKLTTYFGERHRTAEEFVADALLDLSGGRGVEASVMLRGAQGFGHKHRLRTDRLLTLSEDLPLVSVAVDTRQRIEALLDEVIAIKRGGLVTLERARMLTGE